MSDLIDRQALLKRLKRHQYWWEINENYGIESIIEKFPSAQPEPKKGKWILDEDPHDGDCRCSVCLMAIDQMHERHHGMLNALTGGKWWRFYKFCSNCGADMRGEES